MFVSLNQPLPAHPLIKDKHPFRCDMCIGLFNRIAIVIRPVRIAQKIAMYQKMQGQKLMQACIMQAEYIYGCLHYGITQST